MALRCTTNHSPRHEMSDFTSNASLLAADRVAELRPEDAVVADLVPLLAGLDPARARLGHVEREELRVGRRRRRGARAARGCRAGRRRRGGASSRRRGRSTSLTCWYAPSGKKKGIARSGSSFTMASQRASRRASNAAPLGVRDVVGLGQRRRIGRGDRGRRSRAARLDGARRRAPGAGQLGQGHRGRGVGHRRARRGCSREGDTARARRARRRARHARSMPTPRAPDRHCCAPAIPARRRSARRLRCARQPGTSDDRGPARRS